MLLETEILWPRCAFSAAVRLILLLFSYSIPLVACYKTSYFRNGSISVTESEKQDHGFGRKLGEKKSVLPLLVRKCHTVQSDADYRVI